MRAVIKEEKGAVLILVLWVVALLSMLGGYFTLETTLRRNMSYNSWNQLRARLTIESVLSLVGPHIKPFGQEVDDKEKFIVPDGSTYKLEIGGQTVAFSIEDERGKLDINKATEDELVDFFEGFLGKGQGKDLAAAILDWRDNDDDERPGGAEKDYYLSLEPPYEPANGKFVLLEQLLLVRGVNPEIYWGPLKWGEVSDSGEEVSWQGGLQDLLTVYNGSDKIVEDIAPQPLIDIMEKEYFKDGQGLGTLRFKTCAYQSCYQIFFTEAGSSKSGFNLVHWQQIPRF
ncbi:MAG: general secretion pathway protein GspK [Thermodesulfobacteria bacterium]|nr:general secretion pathway protein GspK [Thermodesulfobacteriota bacterium]